MRYQRSIEKVKKMNDTKKTVTVTPKWAITIIVGSVLSGMVTGAFGVANVLNSDHYALLAFTEKVNKLEQTTVNREFYDTRYLTLCEKIDTLTKKVENLTTSVNNLYSR